ncbi:MAG: heavy metal transport/detoxification protein [Aquabacterium sp.]|jgi:copper chaperone|nr:MAG: heavy metal transport/detoxification protein [Aquabacterium sp.]
MNPTIQTLELPVKGMSCGHCVRAVTTAVQQQDPQAQVQVDLQQGRVRVTSSLTREAVAQAIREEGYEVAA